MNTSIVAIMDAHLFQAAVMHGECVLMRFCIKYIMCVIFHHLDFVLTEAPGRYQTDKSLPKPSNLFCLKAAFAI